MNRRSFIRTAAGLLVAAPMVVRAESIMRVRPVEPCGNLLIDPEWVRVTQAWLNDGRYQDVIVRSIQRMEVLRDKGVWPGCLERV